MATPATTAIVTVLKKRCCMAGILGLRRRRRRTTMAAAVLATPIFRAAQVPAIASPVELVERIRRIDRQAGGNEIPVGSVYFAKDYVTQGLLSKKRYPQGRRAIVLPVHEHLDEITHVDLRLPDGEFLSEVPIDYIRTLD